MRNNQIFPIVGALFYAFGALAGLLLIAISTWGDYEAASYGFQRRASAQLRGLTCPILLTRNETGAISLIVSNPTDNPLHPSIRTEISAAFDPQVFIESIDLAPGESKRLEWSVGPDNVDLGYFIFANVQVYASFPIPNRETTCGILIVDLPVNGNMLIVAAFPLSLIGMGFGLYMYTKQSASRAGQTLRPMIFLTGLIAAGLFFSFMGWWLQNILVLVFAALIIVVTINALIFKAE